MINAYEEFLIKQNILPLDNWNQFESDHQTAMVPNSKNPHTTMMRNQGKMVGGVYIYFDEETCLYVGESGNLGARFKDHYNESWKQKDNSKYHAFFGQYRKVLTVKWIEIENVIDRRIIEAMLTRICNPTYISFIKN